MNTNPTPIYLDHNATTPVDPRVLEAMLPFFRESFGNAASRHHRFGCDASAAVERARLQVAELIGADPREIIFTSGATESNNLAILGVVRSPVHGAKGRHIVTVRTEHKAVLDPCAHLAGQGCSVTYLMVDGDGRIDIGELADAITDETILVSVMHANNETGVLQPITAIGRLCKERGVLFHTDATQAAGREPIDVEACGIDLLSLSAHKMYGPKGVGALYARRRRPRVRCEPILHGGGHERGLRSGTVNVPGAVGLGVAATLAIAERAVDNERMRRLRDRLENELVRRLPDVRVNGHADQRLSNTASLSFAGVDGDALMKAMPDVAVSSSSACTSASLAPSYVLGAMGLSDDLMAGSVRFSVGRFTTEAEIDRAINRVVDTVISLRAG